MTAEHLLDAMGLLDDDLIQEAERVTVRMRRLRVGQWLSLAASLALVIALGYGAVRLDLISGMKGSAGSSGGAAAPMSPAASIPAGSEAGAPDVGAVSGDGAQSGNSVRDEAEIPLQPEEQTPIFLEGFIQLEQGAGVYLLTGLTADLPEGAALLGTLSAQGPDAPYPVTSVEEYAGLELWAVGPEPFAGLYVRLPDGQYAAAELVEP